MIFAVHYTSEGMIIKIMYDKPQLRKSERTQGLAFPIPMITPPQCSSARFILGTSRGCSCAKYAMAHIK